MMTTSTKLNTQWRRWAQLLLISLLAAWFASVCAIRATQAEETASLGTISGTVWFDQNRNGIHEPNEPLIANRPVHLEGSGADLAGAMVAMVETDANGFFAFPNIELGAYRIYTPNGASTEVILSQERGVATVELAFNGLQVYLPMVGR